MSYVLIGGKWWRLLPCGCCCEEVHTRQMDRTEAENERLRGELAEAEQRVTAMEGRAVAAEADKIKLHDWGSYWKSEAYRLREGLRPFVEDFDFHAADYLAERVDGEEARVFTARTVDLLIEHQRKARSLLAGGEAEPVYCVCGNVLGSANCCPEPDGGGA